MCQSVHKSLRGRAFYQACLSLTTAAIRPFFVSKAGLRSIHNAYISMLTKLQKKEHVALSAKSIKESKNLVFADFTGVPTKDVNQLKAELRKVGATFKVVKKNLLAIALTNEGVTFDPNLFKAPIATVFAKDSLTSVAAPIYKFSKDLAKRKISFKVVGVFDNEKKVVISEQEFTAIAKLPSREVLLGQVVGVMSGPIRAFMYVVSELAKKGPATPVAATPAPEAPKEAPAPASAA